MLAYVRHIRPRLLQIADGLLFTLALTLAYWLRATFPWLGLPELETFEKYLWLLPLVGVLGPLMLASQGFYEPPRIPSRLVVILQGLRSSAFLVGGLILMIFLARTQFIRSVVILVGAFGGLLVLLRPGRLTASPCRLVVEEFGGEPVFYYRAQAAEPWHLFVNHHAQI